MLRLLAASVLWAFSFGLTKNFLGGIDARLVTFVRLALSLAVVSPWLFSWRMPSRLAATLMGIGSLQFGLMYLALNASYPYLASYQVALLTVFTPIYVALIADGLARRFRPRTWLAATVSVAAAAIVILRISSGTESPAWPGVLLLQGSNLAFAIGQVSYRNLLRSQPQLSDSQAIGWLYAGGVLVALVAGVPRLGQGLPHLTSSQLGVLVYLGVVASGLGFYLWNSGARRTSVGQVAVMNNAKVPLAVFVSLLVFEGPVDWRTMARAALATLLVLLALWLASREPNSSRLA